MKKALFALLTLSTLLFAACGGSSPSDTVEAFFDAGNEGDFTKAQELCTGQAAQLMGLAVSMMGDEKPEPDDKADIEIVSEEVDGDTATVTIKDKKDGKEAEIGLQKVDGKWKISTLPKD
ncbi:MAG: DUF4878 domain-containing protein [Opitutales bacterium]